jgi:hypothetical protein
MLKRDGGSCAQRTDSTKKNCAGGACPLSNSNTLVFFVPFAIVSLVNQVQTQTAALGQTCDGCVVTQLAPGICAGFVSLALYRGIKYLRHQLSATPADNLPIQADYMEKANLSAEEFESEKSGASKK